MIAQTTSVHAVKFSTPAQFWISYTLVMPHLQSSHTPGNQVTPGRLHKGETGPSSNLRRTNPAAGMGGGRQLVRLLGAEQPAKTQQVLTGSYASVLVHSFGLAQRARRTGQQRALTVLHWACPWSAAVPRIAESPLADSHSSESPALSVRIGHVRDRHPAAVDTLRLPIHIVRLAGDAHA